MKPTAREFYWFKLSRLSNLTSSAKGVLYKHLAATGEEIDSIFSYSKAAFEAAFPEFGKPPFDTIKYGMLDSISRTELIETFRTLNPEIQLLCLDDRRYPTHLRNRLGAAAPPVLFVRGLPQLFNRRTVFVLGAEEIDEHEKRVLWKIVWHITRAGYHITSTHNWGSADEIHRAALNTEGTTGGFVGGGIQDFSFKKNIRVFDWQRNTLFASPFHPLARSTANFRAKQLLLSLLDADAVIVVPGRNMDDQSSNFKHLEEVVGRVKRWEIPLFVPSRTLLPYAAPYPHWLMEVTQTFDHPKAIVQSLPDPFSPIARSDRLGFRLT